MADKQAKQLEVLDRAMQWVISPIYCLRGESVELRVLITKTTQTDSADFHSSTWISLILCLRQKVAKWARIFVTWVVASLRPQITKNLAFGKLFKNHRKPGRSIIKIYAVLGILMVGASSAYGALSATFNNSYDVSITAEGYTAGGDLSLALNFPPTPEQQLLVVNNTGSGSISGTFAGLVEGSMVTSTHGGNTFTFRISYVGGDGNDITLTRVGAAGQVTSGGGYLWSPLAGSLGGPGSLDAVGPRASFFNPQGAAVDHAGNVYVADQFNHTIRKVTPTGVVTTLAGCAGQAGSIDGTASAARFNNPTGVAVDEEGTLFVADKSNHTIRKVTAEGIVTTLAGSAASSGSTDGTGGDARFNSPYGLAVDMSGNIYVADLGNHLIRKVTSAGLVTTLAGNAGSPGSSDGNGNAARFNSPFGVAVDSTGRVYVVDTYNHTIRIVTADGVVTTWAGSAGLSGREDGMGVAARFAYPTGVTVDNAGNVYVTDYSNYTIRRITSLGFVSTLAGNAGHSGNTDGTGGDARFNSPTGVAVDSSGNAYVTDAGSHTIRKMTASGMVNTFAGTPLSSGSSDGDGGGARFNYPTGAAVDTIGNVYLADEMNHTIRKVTPAGVVTTFAGSAGLSGITDGTGDTARFKNPTGVAVDGSGNLYVADYSNHTIRKVTPAGVVTTLAGSAGLSGSTDGTGVTVRFNYPVGVAVDSNGNVYVADRNNHVIRKVASSGLVTTLAGNFGSIGSDNGTGSAARFSYPRGVAVDKSGNVYVADQSGHMIRKVTSAGEVTTLAGSAYLYGSVEGMGDVARFNYPTGLAVDNKGVVYVADQFNHTIRKVTQGGVVSTIGGLARMAGHEPGYGSAARFYYPQGIAVSASGQLYVSDDNHRVAQGQFSNGFQPIVTLEAVSGIGLTGATLNGTVNPNGFVTTASFEYGTTQAYGNTVSLDLSPANGTTGQNVSAVLSGLNSGTLYYYRLTATNVDGTSSTSGGTFSTISSNANLSKLNLTGITLSPIFSSAVNGYTAIVGNPTTSVTVTPTLAHVDASLEVRINSGPYAALSSGGASGSIPLNVGSNTIDVRVTAQDGVTQKIYTVTITRLAATLDPSFNGGSEIPFTSAGFVAAGTSLGSVSLGFAPTPGQQLVVVNNTGSGSISGTFTGLSEGSMVTSTHGGNTFTFRISYAGGDGNDITLTRIGAAGQVVSSNTYLWSHLAGNPTGVAGSFYSPQATAVDGLGNIYVADQFNHTIRKVTPAGIVSILAGSAGLSGTNDGSGNGARFNSPRGLAVDDQGNVYVTDSSNHTIRKVTPYGNVSTIAGSAGSSGNSDGTGSAARFFGPVGISVDRNGDLYVADTSNHTIRKVTSAGVVTTFAGSAGLTGSADGTGSAARFNNPFGIAVDSVGTAYVADTYNHTIRKVNSMGVVSTLVGSAGQGAFSDGMGGAARFAYPAGVAVDVSGNVYAADYGSHTIRKVTATGLVTTLAGTAFSSGRSDGTSSAALFNGPCGLSIDSVGSIYVADSSNDAIRKVTSAGVVTTFAGNSNLRGADDGLASSARLNTPAGVAVDSGGNTFIADSYNHTIRKVTPSGVVTTLAGSAGLAGSLNGTGSTARFNTPSGVAVDASGNVYVVDHSNHTLRKISTSGMVTTLAGSPGEGGSSDGTGSAARFYFPWSVAVDGSGNLFVTDTFNQTVRKVTSAGVVTTVAGSAGLVGSIDGTGSMARFAYPRGVSLDGIGNLYVSDSRHTIRKITSLGMVSTLAGDAWIGGGNDGIGSNASFLFPRGLAADASGNTYVADLNNHAIRKVTSTGEVTTIGGLAAVGGHEAGYGANSRFYYPQGIAVSSSGRLYVVDQNHRLVQGELAGFQPIVAQGSVTGIGVGGATVSGTINPNGFVTTAFVEYGPTQAYGSAASLTLSPTNGTTAQNVSVGIANLSPGTLYYYRIKAANVDGTSTTTGGTFTTLSADLSGLALSSGTLSPTFSSSTTTYSASVVNSVTSITVTPTRAQANASISVRVNAGAYVAVSSGSPSSALSLSVGNNTVDVRVVAQDGISQKIYTVTVTRSEPILNPSFNMGSDVPVTSSGFVATGNSLGTISLGFTPGAQQVLRLVNNTGTSAVSGTFTGLAEGATVTTNYGGNTYGFRISYVGGDGNDIILTRIGLPGQVSSGGSYLWSTLAGSLGGLGSLDASGAQASFMEPRGTAVDSSGNVYVADTSNHTIRKVTSSGVVTTLAGIAGVSGSSDGATTAARFYNPTGVAVDTSGNVYVADQLNHVIRKVSPAGEVTTLAGSAGLAGSMDGTGNTARFNGPRGIAVDTSGNVYVADQYNFTIRKVSPVGVVTTLAGSAGNSGSMDGAGSAALFNRPIGVAVDSSGSVFVADQWSHTIRKVTSTGVVTTLAGSPGISGNSDGTGTAARFSSPTGIAVDGGGNVYVADQGNYTIRKVTSAGVVSTMAGTAGSSGSTDGTGGLARFRQPDGVAVDITGNVYIGDSSNFSIRKVTSAGGVTTLAGAASITGSSNGTGGDARFYFPVGMAVDGAGNTYVADRENSIIRKVTASGVVTTLAGTAGSTGTVDGTGSAARFRWPEGVAVDSTGNVYVADSGNHTIRKVTPAGVVSTLAGTAGSSGSTDGTGSAARFSAPSGVAVDSLGNIYVAESSSNTIRKVSAAGVVTTLAGSAGLAGSQDGIRTDARFSYPSGIAVDSTGNLFVVDLETHIVRKISSTGVVTTLAGSAGLAGNSDGTGSFARFYMPWGICLDAAGNLYVCDQYNHTIRKVTQEGVVTTLGGLARMAGHEPGYGRAARFLYPQGIAVSASGRLYVSDDNHRVAQGQFFNGFQPVVTLGSVSGVSLTGVTLNGTVNPNGFVTTASFEYGTTLAYGSSVSVNLSPANGTTGQNVSAVLGGLSSGTLYYYRLTATNADGTTSTSGGTFATISTNANLSGLTMSNGTLSPVFASDTTNYTASVGNATTSITVSPSSAQNATFEVRANAGTYAAVTSGGASGLLPLNVGSNTIEVRVTAQDGVTQKIYTVTVTRLAATLNPSFNGSSEVPVTSAGFVATGTSLGTLSLGFAPGPQQVLILVDNTGVGSISGTFTGLSEGSTVTASYGGDTFTFRISYVGGDGNDIVLTRIGAAGQIASGGLYFWSSIAGSLGGSGAMDGIGAQASFFSPGGTAVDGSGNIYVADSSNHTIRKVTSAGVVTTLAGSAGLSGSSDGTGSAARFSNPAGVAVDSSGNVYVADRNNHTIRKVTSAGVLTTLAGSAGSIGATDGTGSAARFYNPNSVAVDGAGNVYVADQSYHTIRKVTSAGVVTTMAGSAVSAGSADGTGSAARFNSPTGVAVDGAGNVYVADQNNHTIRKVTSAGVVTTLAGSAGLGGSIDGAASFARFNTPRSVAVDSTGNIYVADQNNHTIRRVTPTGTVTTLGGTAAVLGRDSGYGSAARFSSPRGIAVSTSGRLYVADGNHRVAQGQFYSGFQPILTQGIVSGLGLSGATLNGTVNPNGFVTTASFEYGTTLAYGSSVSVNLSPANGAAGQNVSAVLSGLIPGTLYYYRLTATNADGTVSTTGGSFTTFSADLSSISLSRGTLYPGFDGARTSYAASVANATTSITVTPILAQSNTTVSVRVNAGSYAAVTSGSPSSALALNVGNNTIDLRVTAQDGVTQKIYTVTVTRLAATLNASFNWRSEIPVISAGFVATGTSLGALGLGFVPLPQQVLLLVSNTGIGAISGTFTGLAEGSTVTSTYGGNTFTFRISYVGGDGNDISLTRIASAGQVTSSGTYLWSPLAGSLGGAGSLDAESSRALFFNPGGVAIDSAGNTYVADSSNHTIRKVTPGGVVITLAGCAGLRGNADGTGSAARFATPTGVAVDNSGNVYVSDQQNHAIRKVTSDGVVTTLAGAAGTSGSADGTGSAARFFIPTGVAVDSSGNVYVADSGNNTLRKVTSAGVVTTLAGDARNGGSADGTGSVARFSGPVGVAVDGFGNVFVADKFNHTIRKVTPDGIVTTLAGRARISGSTNGTGSDARFNNPTGIAIDNSGYAYVADQSSQTIRKITPAGLVTTLAGQVLFSGSIDGTGSGAMFSNPTGVAVDGVGNVYVADQNNHTIRKVTATGIVTTLVGSVNESGSIDSTGSVARFQNPWSIAVDSAGNAYVADSSNHTIRKVTSAGVVTTLAGSAGSAGSTDGTGGAARFNTPTGVAVDGAGNVYVADQINNGIRKVTPTGAVTTLAGISMGGWGGSSDGTGSSAQFLRPTGVAVDASGNVYVADRNNHTIRKVTSAGVVTTLAGSAGTAGSTDGTGNAARFNNPTGVAVDASGNVYVADSGNHTIRKVTSAGVVTTLAGRQWYSGSEDGVGNTARFNNPTGVVVDSSGNVYVADQNNHTIRKITSSGNVTTIGGLAAFAGGDPGFGIGARFSSPRGIAVSASGRLYVTDGNHRVVQGVVAGFQPILTQGSISGIGVSGATLSGTVNPNGFVTSVNFEYGRTLAYGNSVSANLSSSNGSTAQNVSASLSGLDSGTLYYYRLTATNVDGTATTSGGSFTTYSADLSSLALSSGTLSPTFSSSTTAYTAIVGNGTTSITITPTLQANSTMVMRINAGAYAAITSGSASAALALNVGSNTIEVRVTAQDGVSQKVYSLTVLRLAETLNPGFNGGEDVPVTSAGFMATGTLLGTVNMGFSPSPGQQMIVVNNNGSSSISGTFTGLAEGSMVSASYGGNTFTFRISYVGGDGNDITLTRVGAAGQISRDGTYGAYKWSLLAGNSGSTGSTDGSGPMASFYGPLGTSVDGSGNIYVADASNHTIRRVTPAGVVTTLAGSPGLSGSSDGTGSAARFNYPSGLAVDGSGNVYVADTNNHTIRKVTPAGVVSTLAGIAGTPGFTAGTGSGLLFYYPRGIAVDSAGTVFVADSGNNAVRKIDSSGVVTTLAGFGYWYAGSSDGYLGSASFKNPQAVAVDASGNVYVADTGNYTIRKMSPSGFVTTLAGFAGISYSLDGTGNGAFFGLPQGVAVDSSGNLFVADSSNHTIRKVTSTGVVSTLAGNAGLIGSSDGSGGIARFNFPTGLAVDSAGNIYVGDRSNHTIRKVSASGDVMTLAGSAAIGSSDGTGSAAKFNFPSGVAVDSAGNALVTDSFSHTIRKVLSNGVVTTLAGSAGLSGGVDGAGNAARFFMPQAAAVDGSGNIYIADGSNHVIRKVAPSGLVTTLAGSAALSGSIDGTGSAARFNSPAGVSVDSLGNIYVADSANHTIRKVSATGEVITLAGSAGQSGSNDGIGSAARFNFPRGVALDRSGNMYVADRTAVRKVTPAGVVTTLAGMAGSSGSNDGTGSAARFYNPAGVAVDKLGNVYVADKSNHTIRKVTSSGVVTTLGGKAGFSGINTGEGINARFSNPEGIDVSADGRVFVVDQNHRLVQGEVVGFQPILTQGSASGIGVNEATLNGTVNPNGFVTTAVFEYGTTLAYGSSASVTLSPSNGTESQNVSASLTGLNSGTLYYYRITATNVDGTTSTNGSTFTTSLSTNADLVNLGLSSGLLSPAFAGPQTSYSASVGIATASIKVTPTLDQADATIAVRINGGLYATVTSGSSSESLELNPGRNSIDIRVTAQDGVTQKTYSVEVIRMALPTVTDPTAGGISSNEANLGGDVNSDGWDPITERGVVYSKSAENDCPLIGVEGVTRVTAGGATGVFSVMATGLYPGTRYHFRAYAINSQGINYSSLGDFTTLTPLQDWRRERFGSTSNTGNASDEADPDGDGIPNLLEYVLGGDPILPNPNIAPRAAVVNGNLIFIFQRPDYAETSDVSVSVETSTDLGTWQQTYGISPGPPAPQVSIEENGTNPDIITVTIPANANQRFTRLKASLNP